MDIKDVIGDYESFLNTISTHLEESKIMNEEIKEIDHICYRVDSKELYLIKKNSLRAFGEIISENNIKGREISIIKLFNALTHLKFEIPCIELPSPKQNHKYKNGLEHAEVVIKSDLEEFENNHKNINFEYSSPTPLNPELIVEFKDDTSIKFHTKSIEEVVRLEKIN